MNEWGLEEGVAYQARSVAEPDDEAVRAAAEIGQSRPLSPMTAGTLTHICDDEGYCKEKGITTARRST